MPKLLEVVEIKIQVGDLETQIRHPRPTHKRSSGVHLSQIIRKVAEQSKLLKLPARGRSTFSQPEEDLPLCMAVGVAMEEFLVGLYPEMNWQPGELNMGGISGNPDGLSEITSDGFGVVAAAVAKLTGVIAVEEFKATWKSERTHPILREWMWLMQCSGYCSMAGTRFARLHVIWIAGSYFPPEPRYMRYLLEFDQQELDKNWAMFVRNK